MAAGSSESSLPTTLDWYRQGATWIVGLSTGALAFSVGWLRDRPLDSPWMNRSLGAASFFFLAATVTGVVFYWHLTTAGNRRETLATNRRELADGPRATAHEAEAARRNGLTQDNTKLEADLRRTEARLGLLYVLSLGWLACAAASLFLFISIAVWATEGQAVAAKGEFVPLGPLSSAGSGDRQVAFLLNKDTGEIWELDVARDRPTSLRRLPVDAADPTSDLRLPIHKSRAVFAARISPFPFGQACAEPRPPAFEAPCFVLEHQIAALRDQLRGASAVLVVGSTDSRPLLPNFPSPFQAGAALAQARAAWVKAIVSRGQSHESPDVVLALASGPALTPPSALAEDVMGNHASVDVWIVRDTTGR
jgi:hypothetical protein